MNYYLKLGGLKEFIRRSKCKSKMNLLQQRRAEYVNFNARLGIYRFVPIFAVMTSIFGLEARLVNDFLHGFLACFLTIAHSHYLGKIFHDFS